MRRLRIYLSIRQAHTHQADSKEAPDNVTAFFVSTIQTSSNIACMVQELLLDHGSMQNDHATVLRAAQAFTFIRQWLA